MGFTTTIREVKMAAGAGFVYPLVGSMSTMPGPSSLPLSALVHTG